MRLVSKDKKFILWFDEVNMKDVGLVGGKNASLGEMYQELTKKKINIPYGFAVTAYAYRYLLEKAGVEDEIEQALKGLNIKDIRNLSTRGKKVRDIIRKCDFPPELHKAITEAYHKLSKKYKTKNTDVAVRSSATAEDLPEASFAGQQETYLNIHNEKALISACKKCFASLFTNRAIAYREEKGFDHFKVYLSIGVQKMVRSDKASSGVMFTLDTETGFDDVVFVTASWGLGENVVQGAVNPDEFHIFEPTLLKGYKPIITKSLGSKSKTMIYAKGKEPTKNTNTPIKKQKEFCLKDEEVLQLAKWAGTIEKHYTKKKGTWTPMDIEWAKDGKSSKLYVVQARPETVQSQKQRHTLKEYKIKEKGEIITTGKSVGSKIANGKAAVIKNVKEIEKFKPGQILVTEMTDPDWVPIMRQAAAIVTDKGGRTCHAAIVSRELGIPCIVGTTEATSKIKNKQSITTDCSQGEEGLIYKGELKFEIKKTNIKNFPKTKTKVMMNIGSPNEAFELSFIPNSGVGLAREEFIINSYIKIHPMALIDYKKMPKHTKKKIDALTQGYKDKKQFFIDKLARGVGTIAAAFYPNDVIVRMSDFKSNEYANLIGGKLYEPKEDNPMIGWRGASRYYNPKYAPAFALECKALRKVREEFGLMNVKIMIPFCRTVKEGKKVIKEMKKNGLEQGKNGLQVYVMCEIPSNVVLADEFSKVFDGFSIGTNDLTQLTLGLDRDSELVADLYDERNEAVKDLVHYVIDKAKKNKRKIGLCGDAPSTYPEFAQFLVECGIDSISLSPDAVVKTTLAIAEMEKN
ncbi:phosphoenolpyruvate synthase [Candidatus Woesearchaeota archaeon]|nr:phosphoenolpyruvate synthase [Candidatus Woesearchaeota archaeon]